MDTFELEYRIGTIEVAALELLAFAETSRIFLFYAQMGAGKTTFIKELCKSLGSTDNFSSPTFSIVNEYNSPVGKIYHFDLYRLKNLEDLLDLGFEEYVNSAHYCFIEWPELAENILGEGFIKIEIRSGENIRYLHAAKV